MTRTIFVTGTDTGVGKTMVSAALLAAATERGLVARAYKPVETGCPEQDGVRYGLDCRRLAAGTTRPDDARILRAARRLHRWRQEMIDGSGSDRDGRAAA